MYSPGKKSGCEWSYKTILTSATKLTFIGMLEKKFETCLIATVECKQTVRMRRFGSKLGFVFCRRDKGFMVNHLFISGNCVLLGIEIYHKWKWVIIFSIKTFLFQQNIHIGTQTGHHHYGKWCECDARAQTSALLWLSNQC